MDLEKVLAEIEEALAKATPGPWHADRDPREGMEDNTFIRYGGLDLFFPSARDGADDDAYALCILRNHAPLLLAALKVAIARNNERGVMVWHSGLGDATEQAEAAFKALAEGE